MIVGELSARQIGKTVTVAAGVETVTGRLLGVIHEVVEVDDSAYSMETDLDPAPSTRLNIGRWGYVDYPASTECTLL